MKKITIAIDGTAGVGKSSVGKAVASKYGYVFLGTGEMYRCLGYKVVSMGIDPQDCEKVLEVAENIDWSFERRPDSSLKVLVDGEYFGDKLLLEETGRAASKVAANGPARAILTQIQKDLGAKGGIVMEGRDIGTVVCPNAAVKIYLDASAEARAHRRVKQLKENGQPADYQAILESIESRDARDKGRDCAPLKAADDALVIDTSDLSLEQVIDKVIKRVETYAS